MKTLIAFGAMLVALGVAPAARAGGAPLNGADDCADAIEIAGNGVWAFDFALATTDGPTHQACFSANSTQIWRDRWWKWTALATGSVTIDTCGQSTINTRLAIYRPAAQCPTSNEYLLQCIDDACSLQPSVTFLAQQGQTYLLRLGRTGFVESPASGSGTFTISGPTGAFCPPNPGPCNPPFDFGVPAHQSNQFNRCADDFVLSQSAPITGVCWWGSYFQFVPPTDGFTVTYWTNAGNRPGNPIATFTQQSGLQVQRIGTNDSDYQDRRIFQYKASHAPVMLQPGQTYWIEVRNFVDGVAWRWQSHDKAGTGNGAVQDPSPGSDWSFTFPIEDLAWCLTLDTTCAVDTNGDGVIDFGDLNNVLDAYNSTCP